MRGGYRLCGRRGRDCIGVDAAPHATAGGGDGGVGAGDDVMADARRTHSRDQRCALADDAAAEVAAFYRRLRAEKIPAAAATAMSEAYVAGVVARDDEPREPWQE